MSGKEIALTRIDVGVGKARYMSIEVDIISNEKPITRYTRWRAQLNGKPITGWLGTPKIAAFTAIKEIHDAKVSATAGPNPTPIAPTAG